MLIGLLALAQLLATSSFDNGISSEPPPKSAKTKVLFAPKPAYPLSARARNFEGAGVFELDLHSDGTVDSIKILKSTGHPELDEAASNAFHRWRFRPAEGLKKVKIPIRYTMSGFHPSERQKAEMAESIGDYDKALSLANKAIELKPNDSKNYVVRGWVYSKRARAKADPADEDKAIADFTTAIRTDPRSADAYERRARVYESKDNYDAALADVNEAIRIEPRYYRYNLRGNIWDAKGNLDRALADLNEAVRLNPTDYSCLCDRGCIFTKKGDYDKALEDITASIKFDPASPTSYYDRGCVYNLMQQYDKAIADFDKAIALKPRLNAFSDPRSAAYSNRGSAYYHTGEYEKAFSDCNAAIDRDPKDWHPYNEIAWILATCPNSKTRDDSKAIACATKASELSAWRRSTTVDTLAAAYAQSGKFDDAVKFEQKALEVAATNDKHIAEYRSRLELYLAKTPYREEKPPPIQPEN